MSILPEFVKRHKLWSTVVVLVVVPVAVFAIWSALALSYTYSAGERAGFLQKVSKRGWLCKTWEGEMQLSAIPGSMPEKFVFSTRSDSVAALLNQYNGQRVVLDYEQHVHVPTSCFGDTEYFVIGVRPVK